MKVALNQLQAALDAVEPCVNAVEPGVNAVEPVIHRGNEAVESGIHDCAQVNVQRHIRPDAQDYGGERNDFTDRHVRFPRIACNNSLTSMSRLHLKIKL